jgi:cystathionine gamma-synthase
MGGDALLSGFEDSESYEFETRAIRAGQPHDPRTGGVVTPIALATTFAQDAIGHPKNGYEYARTGNPTRHAYQACVASLEGANYGHAFASGLAAEDALLRQLSPG